MSISPHEDARPWTCDDCHREFFSRPYYTLDDEDAPIDPSDAQYHRESDTEHTNYLCPSCAGPFLDPDNPNDPRRPKA